MIIEVVVSPVRDEKFGSNLQNSEVWKNAYKPEEVTNEVRGKYPKWYEYHVKFDGLTPIHMTKFREW